MDEAGITRRKTRRRKPRFQKILLRKDQSFYLSGVQINDRFSKLSQQYKILLVNFGEFCAHRNHCLGIEALLNWH